MGKGFYATDFVMFASNSYVKIDLFELEPTMAGDGVITLEKGEVQRITMPLASAKALVSKLSAMLEEGEKNGN